MSRFSVIIACLNDHAFLPRAVDSVLSQSWDAVELIVCDGGSTDGTIEYLKTIELPRLIWRSEKDGGIAEAWNKALTLATGDWLLFLGADDFLWDSQVLARAAPLLEKAPAQTRFAFADVALVEEHGSRTIQTVRYSVKALMRDIRNARGMVLPHQGFFHSRRAFAEGGFDTAFRICADYELMTRDRSATNFLYLPIGTVAAFRMGGLSTNPHASLAIARERMRIQRKHGRGSWRVGWQMAKAWLKLGARRVLGDKIGGALVNASRRLRSLPPYPKV